MVILRVNLTSLHLLLERAHTTVFSKHFLFITILKTKRAFCIFLQHAVLVIAGAPRKAHTNQSILL